MSQVYQYQGEGEVTNVNAKLGGKRMPAEALLDGQNIYDKHIDGKKRPKTILVVVSVSLKNKNLRPAYRRQLWYAKFW